MMETNKNRNAWRNPFYYVAAVTGVIAVAAGGGAFYARKYADQLHQSAVVLHTQSDKHRKNARRASGNIVKANVESRIAQDDELQASQAQLYSNQTSDDIEVAVIAAGASTIVTLGSLAGGAALSRSERQSIEQVTTTGIGQGPEPGPNGSNGYRSHRDQQAAIAESQRI